MNDHVSKPIETHELFSTLLRLIKHKERPAEIEPRIKKKQAEPDLTEVPDIDGINLQAGLKRVGGNCTFYRKLLTRFYEGLSGQRFGAAASHRGG